MKKGQAAMEFLMTYGWAILVVIAAIAALAYFGVLDPSKLLPERCQFPAGMDCIDKAAITSVAPNTVTIALRNNQGFPINVTNAVASVNGVATCGSPLVGVDVNGALLAVGQIVQNNQVFRVQLQNCGLTSGNKFDGTVTVSYTNTDSGLSNQAVGSVRGRVA